LGIADREEFDDTFAVIPGGVPGCVLAGTRSSAKQAGNEQQIAAK
jgi:hypothetical protein